MTASHPMSLNSAICSDNTPLSPAQMGYFQARAQDHAHEMVLNLFLQLAEDKELTRAGLATRIRKKPEQVTRWLSSPGNWELSTMSNLLLGMGYAPVFGWQKLSSVRQGNYYHSMVKQEIQPLVQLGGAANPIVIKIAESVDG